VCYRTDAEDFGGRAKPAKRTPGSTTKSPGCARALKIALNFDPPDAGQAHCDHPYAVMRGRKGLYHPEIQEAFAEMRGSSPGIAFDRARRGSHARVARTHVQFLSGTRHSRARPHDSPNSPRYNAAGVNRITLSAHLLPDLSNTL